MKASMADNLVRAPKNFLRSTRNRGSTATDRLLLSSLVSYMNKNERKAKVYNEDTIRRISDNVHGVVTRTWHDIDSSEEGQPLSVGEFEINWLDSYGAYGSRTLRGEELQVLHEDDSNYLVVDRSFGLSDAVKRDSGAAMSGIVQGGSSRLTIRNLATREVRQCQGTDVIVEGERWQVGDYVVCNDWVGIIRSLNRQSIVKLYSGDVILCDEMEMNPVQYEESNVFYPNLLPSTTLVKLSKRAIKRARSTSQLGPQVSRSGVICTSFIAEASIDWQFQNMMVSDFKSTPQPQEDISLTARQSTVGSVLRRAKLIDACFTHQIGDVVRFTCESNQISVDNFANLDPDQAKPLCREWEIIATEQVLQVKWQNGTVSSNRAVELVPYTNVDDLELWPSDHVISKLTGLKGIVQQCDAGERTAVVMWNDSGKAESSSLSESQTESLYELMNNAEFNVDLGDLVLIVPEDGCISHVHNDAITPGGRSWGVSTLLSSVSETLSRYIAGGLGQSSSVASDTGMIEWFGQLIAIETDGTCVVSLCFNDEPRELRVPVTRLVHVASTGYDNDSIATSSTTDSDLSIDSTDPESDAYTTEDSEMQDIADTVPWTDEDGRIVLSEVEDGDWEDDSDDSNMLDEEIIDVVGEDITEPHSSDIVIDLTNGNGDDILPRVADGRQSTPHETIDRDTEVSVAALPVVVQADAFPVSTTSFTPFVVLDIEPTDHAFTKEPLNRRPEAMKRIIQEYKSLKSSLPSGILVRAFESRMDLLRVLILGVSGTPYVYAPMLFDIYLPLAYPQEPPVVHFHSWTNGVGKINPNLYEEGKVCLSLLGTWHGSSSETWTTRSSLLQIFVSLQALVLVREPYYNEAGYDVLSAHDTAVAANNYAERAYVLTRGFIVHALRNSILGLNNELTWLYHGPSQFLKQATEQAESVIAASSGAVESPIDSQSSVNRVSKGALVLLQRTVKDLRGLQESSVNQ